MISKIKEKLEKEMGKELHFKYNGARNQIEEFNGYIENTYNYIFTIRTNESLKSFTYSDLLTLNLEIINNKVDNK